MLSRTEYFTNFAVTIVVNNTFSNLLTWYVMLKMLIYILISLLLDMNVTIGKSIK